MSCLRLFARVAVSALWLNLGCATVTDQVTTQRASRGASVRYEFAVAEDLATIQEKICWTRGRPRALVATGAGAPSRLMVARASNGEPLRIAGDEILVSGDRSHDCVELEIALHDRDPDRDATSTDIPPPSFVWTPTDDIIWFDADQAQRGSASLRWKLPEGMSITAPWVEDEPTPSNPTTTFRVTPEEFEWKTVVQFGRIERRTQVFAGSRVTMSVPAAAPAGFFADVEAWIGDTFDLIAPLYRGVFPRARVVVIIVPVDEGADPVRFGLATRGGAPTVTLFVHREASLPTLRGEWVAVHELLHLCMPYVRSDDAWLSEGFVTYMTEVLRSRGSAYQPTRDAPASLEPVLEGLSPRAQQTLMALVTLHAGFQRGVAEARRLKMSLQQASQQLRELHAFMYVYWGGAAIAMALDHELRMNAPSAGLDDLFIAWSRIAARQSFGTPSPPRIWTARELLVDLQRYDVEGTLSTHLLERAYARAEDDVALFDPARLRGLGFVAGGAEPSPPSLANDPPSAAMRSTIFETHHRTPASPRAPNIP